MFSYNRNCSFTIEIVLLQYIVFSYLPGACVYVSLSLSVSMSVSVSVCLCLCLCLCLSVSLACCPTSHSHTQTLPHKLSLSLTNYSRNLFFCKRTHSIITEHIPYIPHTNSLSLSLTLSLWPMTPFNCQTLPRAFPLRNSCRHCRHFLWAIPAGIAGISSAQFLQQALMRQTYSFAREHILS